MTAKTLTTRLTSLYGVEPPFVAAGMAFVGTTPDLAIAVCRAGDITNGRQVATALALGADGIWVGTRLVASIDAFACKRAA